MAGLDDLETDPMTAMAVEMRHMRQDINEIKETLRTRPCPSALCGDHGQRLVVLEQKNLNTKENNSNLIAWAAIAISLASTLVMIAALILGA